MKKALLDTNFILTAIRNKIDFFEEIKLMEMKIAVPKQVIAEIKRITSSKKKLKFKDEAKLALKLLNKNKFENPDLKQKFTDKGLINYAKKHKDVVIATLDREIKSKTKNPKLIIRNKKKLELH